MPETKMVYGMVYVSGLACTGLGYTKIDLYLELLTFLINFSGPGWEKLGDQSVV